MAFEIQRFFESYIMHLIGRDKRATEGWGVTAPLACSSYPPSVRELCEDHAQKLVPAGKSSCAMIPFVSSHALPELVHGKIVEQLSKEGPSLVHAKPSKGHRC